MVKINKKKKKISAARRRTRQSKQVIRRESKKKKKTKKKKSLSTMISVKRFCEGAKLSVFFFFLPLCAAPGNGSCRCLNSLGPPVCRKEKRLDKDDVKWEKSWTVSYSLQKKKKRRSETQNTLHCLSKIYVHVKTQRGKSEKNVRTRPSPLRFRLPRQIRHAFLAQQVQFRREKA